METISLEIDEFLNHVCFNSVSYEELYKYVYRRTGFNEFSLSMFQTGLETWVNNLIEKEANHLNFPDFLDETAIFAKLKNKYKLLGSQLDCINNILQKGINEDIDYHPTIRSLSVEDCNRVSTILDYTDPLINGTGVMDGNDYIGEILDDEKMMQGAKIIQQLYEKYKDFQFDAMVLKSPYNNQFSDRLYYFSRLFEVYTKRVKFILELMQCDEKVNDTAATNPNHSKSLKELFVNENDYKKCMEVLTICAPALCKYDDNLKSYIFIGNKKTQKGCVAQWFKYLKSKGIITQDISRDELAETLSNEITNFSISGSSIDNQSKVYKDDFESELINLFSCN